MNTTLQPIPELDNRSESQKEQLHDWLAELGIRGAIEKLRDEWGILVTYNKLQRYRKRLLEKEQLAEHLEHEIAMPEYLALLNGRPVPYDEAGLALIQKRAFELAHQPKVSPAKLATLQRIFNYKTARADAERRLAQADRRDDLSEQSLKLRREQFEDLRQHRAQIRAAKASQNSELAKQADHLGPIATDWKGVGERVCKLFGITPEEEARRAELHKTWKDPHARPGIPEEINPVDD